MLAFFSGPVTVALFHFATKLVGYTDLPLNACSQVIYPELAASYRKNNANDLKSTLFEVYPPFISTVITNGAFYNALQQADHKYLIY